MNKILIPQKNEKKPYKIPKGVSKKESTSQKKRVNNNNNKNNTANSATLL